jgi:hypothetical protein
MRSKPPKSPQTKKALSYAKDRRNDYGENDKASRRAIPLRRAAESRKVRRKAHQSLKALEHAEEEAAAVSESELRQDLERTGGWTKTPDQPLGAYLARHLKLRRMREKRDEGGTG